MRAYRCLTVVTVVTLVTAAACSDSPAGPNTTADGGGVGSDDAGGLPGDEDAGADGDGGKSCTKASDCPGTDDDCTQRTCNAGKCGVRHTANNSPITKQTVGDCKMVVCDGAGKTKSIAADDDVPDDQSPCTTDTCSDGVPLNTSVASGTTCGQDLICDADGACVGCVDAADCPGTDDECRTRTCINGTCGFSFTANGTALTTQTAGDCKARVCDGAGNVTSQNDDADVPVDGNDCTDDVCTAGVPSNPNATSGSPCANGSVCNGAGVCVQCVTAANCPGQDTECQTRTCTIGLCGFSFTPAGVAVTTQTPGDCQRNVCDGAGGITTSPDDDDVAVGGGTQCPTNACVGGVPTDAPVPAGTACDENGGLVCNGAGACVECVTAETCPGEDTACQTRTCAAGVCGFSFAPQGTEVGMQTLGDCQKIVCDGAGSVGSIPDDTDLPADDGNPCTSDVCIDGVVAHPNAAAGEACNQNGGSVCNGAGACVECVTAADCPGTDSDCERRTCSAGACGRAFEALGTPVSSQTANDCKRNVCDGAGAVISIDDNDDPPVDDGDDCTADVCVDGEASHPTAEAGTVCNQNGGSVCDANGNCIATTSVASTTPGDGASVHASTSIAVAFTRPMNLATLTAQTAAGACSGSIQVSVDDFATCVAFASASAAMSDGNTVATFTPVPGLLVNRVYKIRVMTDALDTVGVPLAQAYTSPTGFSTTGPDRFDGSLVISQVYGGGGSVGATYKNDFVELHNRGTTPVSLAGLHLVYGSATGNTWANRVALNGETIPPGGYFLVQLGGAGNGVGMTLPQAQQTWNQDIGAANGKIAIITGAAALPTGTCPDATRVIDFVGYGNANCAKAGPGSAAAPAISVTMSAQRKLSGCTDTGVSGNDFEAAAPAPRNSLSPVSACNGCPVVQNETGSALEVNYCNVQHPVSLKADPGATTDTIYGRVYHAGVTEAAGASASVRVELGYGPLTSNPQYQSGWTWVPATFNAQVGDDDEYQASFVAPTTEGTYAYVYRVSLDAGQTWTYCDRNEGDFGAGSNDDLTFDLARMGTLEVSEP